MIRRYRSSSEYNASFDCLKLESYLYFCRCNNRYFESRYSSFAISYTPVAFNENTNLDLLKVEKYSLNLPENGKLHHTDKYELMRNSKNLVIRRGQEFFIDVYFNRPFDLERDRISFNFNFCDKEGSQPAPSSVNGVLNFVPLLTGTISSFKNYWTARVEEVDSKLNLIKICLKSSSDLAVGKYKIYIDTKLKDHDDALGFEFKELLYVIFNPWNSDDQVYIEDEDKRTEYVLEETGLIWRGNKDLMGPTAWAFSQFEKDILDCAFYILSGPGKLKLKARKDPIKVSRALTAAVNSSDDDGVLAGNWTNKYKGGTPPTNWVGSFKILEEYYQTKMPVKFGQCWVFAGVLNTVCRTLGIPVRPVTNFSSGHDTDGSCTIDFILDQNNEILKSNSESVWNFHVWNEAWMNRPDLGSEYGGWQVIDATPQERSSNFYQCGPTSLVAVKKGELSKQFDGNFVYSEINADVITWLYRGPDQPLKFIGKDTNTIGLKISTKAVGSDDREDLTDAYKFSEKSVEERETMLNALREANGSYSRFTLNHEFNEVLFELQANDDVIIGSEFSVGLRVKNVNSEKKFKIKGNLRVDSTLYTGLIKDMVKREDFEIEIEPETEKFIKMTLNFKNYNLKLTEQGTFNVSCVAKVEETDFEFVAVETFRVRKPNLQMIVENADDLRVGEPFKIDALLENPLPVTLTKCRVLVEAPGITDPIKIPLTKPIKKNQYWNVAFTLTPVVSGRKTISAKFYSKELGDVNGWTTVIIK